MVHVFEEEFSTICNIILEENKTLDEWALIESDDMFQRGNYVGGFDATEMEFCFSVMQGEAEYWFQLTIEDIANVQNGLKREVEVREADL